MFSKIQFKIFGLYDFLMNLFCRKNVLGEKQSPGKARFFVLVEEKSPGMEAGAADGAADGDGDADADGAVDADADGDGDGAITTTPPISVAER